MIPIAEARRTVLSACPTLEPKAVPVRKAHGCVLAEAIRAGGNVPAFTNSAMDGYALRAADTASPPARLQVVDAVMAGGHPGRSLADGESVRIMTGAPMPAGADAVCMVERVRLESGGTVVVIDHQVDPGANVRRAGEDIAAGADVFGPGTVLGPAHLGVLASLGVDSVVAYPRPIVGVLSTGDELAPSTGPLSDGKIRDANRPALLAQLGVDGFRTVDLGVACDDESELGARLDAAASRCDAIVGSGGVSVGDRDVMKVVLEKMGGATMHWMQVAVKPAKPFAFGVLAPRRTPVFGLPGNPVSALVSYELFVRPALRAMAGHQVLDRPRLQAVAEEDLPRGRDGKLHLARVAVRSGDDGVLRVRLAGGQASHMLHAMAAANGLALLPDGEGIRAGGTVEVLVLDVGRLPASAEQNW